jgi:hypothetical protein
MTTRTKKLATLLTAGVALSTGAYALGSQAGDGGAVAAATKDSGAATGAVNVSTGTNGRGPGAPGFGRGRRGGDFGLDALAGRLGVSETALRDAPRWSGSPAARRRSRSAPRSRPRSRPSRRAGWSRSTTW